MIVKSPAKVILSGEHSVVYGKMAIASAISLYTKLQITQIKGNRLLQFRSDEFNEDVTFNNTKPKTILQSIYNLLDLQNSYLITMQSNIPHSSGLGSSAALAVCLAKAFNKPLQIAKEIENIMHGKEGSGLDVEVCQYGGIGQYSKNIGFQKTNLHLSQILLIDSGERKQFGTQGSIEKVRQMYLKQNGKDIINRIGEISEQILNNGFKKELIFENHYLLDQLGLCTRNINNIIEICKQMNIPAKITGAGDGGFCIAFVDEEKLEDLREKLKKYQTYLVKIDYDGYNKQIMNNQDDDIYFVFIQRLFEATESKELIQTLVQNGFDQWEQTKELDLNLLKALKINGQQAQIIMDIIASISNNSLPKLQQSQKPLTLELMQKGLQKRDNSKKSSLPPKAAKNEQLSQATVLSLNGIGLTIINECLSSAHNLQLLQIYDNKLENLVLKDLPNLRIVNAQNNLLKQIDIQSLPNLEKIYLDKNYLSQLPILPQKLTSISISNQNTNEFQFTDDCFDNAIYSLQQLICENSNIEFVMTLGCLQNLEILNLRNNQIKSFEDIEDSLSALNNIREIDLRGNPITQKYKYRDRIVLLCKTIESIDNKNVLPHERQFLINLGKQKIIKRNQSLEPKKGKLPQPSINGKKEKIHFYDNSSNTKLVSKQINAPNNFKDLTPTLLTKHSTLN